MQDRVLPASSQSIHVQKLLEHVNEDEVVKVEEFHVPDEQKEVEEVKESNEQTEIRSRNRSSTSVLKDREKGGVVNTNSLIDTPGDLDFEQEQQHAPKVNQHSVDISELR